MDESPYRGKPLADIIPPDRRRWKVIGLVAASMVAGIGIWELGKTALDAMHTEVATPITSPAQPLPPGYVSPVVLGGPDGRRISLPAADKVVVNVWLQGCGDCMPAFEAARKLEDEGGLGVDNMIVNVAYGSATTEWAAKYGVAKNLVFDPGGTKIVRPLGIGTFTSLVVDPNGTVIHRDRPDQPGYRARMRAALGVKEAALPPPDERGFDHAAVERVVRSHTSEVKRTCWERSEDTTATSTSLTVSVRVAADGTVDSIDTNGDDPAVAACVGRLVEKWKFPPPGSQTTVNIPFKFVRQ